MTAEHGDPVRFGFVTGLLAEARCLTAAGIGEPLTVCSGGDPRQARGGAAVLLARGAAGLVSFGLAGGLDPLLRPGDVVLADAVILPGGERIETDAAALQTLKAAPWAQAAVAGSDRPVATRAEKAALRAATGAAAVDMESHAVAAVARMAGVPFLALRAIADPAERAIPPLAMTGLRPDGRTHARPVAIGLLRRPWLLPALLRLAADSRAGLAALRRAGRWLERLD